MKKFKFSLAPVLDHRERIEDEKQQTFGKHQRELKEAQDELARLDGEFKRHSRSLQSGHKKLTSDQLRWYYAHLEYLDRCITVQHGVVLQRRTAVDRARVEVIAAAKDRKVIEKLKDRRLGEHQALEIAIEQKELDDANNRRPTVSW